MSKHELTRLGLILGVDFYDQSLRNKLPEASFSSLREREEIKARIEALRETNKARSDCNSGEPAGCAELERLSRDNRLSPEQREMVGRLKEKS